MTAKEKKLRPLLDLLKEVMRPYHNLFQEFNRDHRKTSAHLLYRRESLKTITITLNVLKRKRVFYVVGLRGVPPSLLGKNPAITLNQSHQRAPFGN